MLRKLCVIDFGGLQGGSKGGSGGQKFFFGSKCLKLPNSSRKVVRLRSKNFQCICLINTYEIFENQFQKFIFSKMKYAHFLFVQNVRNTGFNYKKVLGIEKFPVENCQHGLKDQSTCSCFSGIWWFIFKPDTNFSKFGPRQFCLGIQICQIWL